MEETYELSERLAEIIEEIKKEVSKPKYLELESERMLYDEQLADIITLAKEVLGEDYSDYLNGQGTNVEKIQFLDREREKLVEKFSGFEDGSVKKFLDYLNRIMVGINESDGTIYIDDDHELVEMDGYNIDIYPYAIIIKSEEGENISTISYTRGVEDKSVIDLLNIETDDIVQFCRFLDSEKSEEDIVNIIIRTIDDYWKNYKGTYAYDYWNKKFNLATNDRTEMRFIFNELLDNMDNGIGSEYFVKYIEGKEMDASTFEFVIDNIDKYESFFGREHELFGDIFSRMFGFDQENSNHDRDLWEHTKSAVKNITQVAKSVEGITEREITLLKVAAILHDIGKAEPGVKKPKEKKGPNGEIEYGYNRHAEKSAELAGPILDKLGYSEEDKSTILKLVEFHDAFIGLNFESEPSKKEKRLSLDEKGLKAHRLFNNKALKDLSTHELKLITIISEADIRAQNPKKAKEKLAKLDIVRELISDKEQVEERQASYEHFAIMCNLENVQEDEKVDVIK